MRYEVVKIVNGYQLWDDAMAAYMEEDEETGLWKGRKGEIWIPSDEEFGWISQFQMTKHKDFSLVGYRDNDGLFSNRGYSSVFWSSSQYDSSDAWYRSFYPSDATVIRGRYSKASGFSVPLIREEK